MNRETLSKYFKGTIIGAGVLCLLFALSSLSPSTLSWKFLIVAFFSAVIAPRMTLQLPKSHFAISFSEAAVFVTFLLFGGPAAILVAALESTANCLYLRTKKFPFGKMMIPTNVSINVVSITVTYLVWLAIPSASLVKADFGTTQHLIITLGSLAFAQFGIASLFAAMFLWLKGIPKLGKTWIQDCFTSSISQITGAGLAGLIFKLTKYDDWVTGVIAFGALGIAYLSYRQSIAEVNSAMQQTEEAEREKADAERHLRQEAEKHAEQLTVMLDKEEKANEALRKSEKDLQHAALHDPLTDLPNRKHFGDMLGRLIDEYNNDPSATFHVLFLDIRKFKNINDSLGHTLGDKVLMVASKRFVRMLSPKDMVARIGGDEFAVILRGLSTVGKAQKVARRLRDSIAQTFSVGGNRVSLDINVGIAPCDTEYRMPEEILRDADIAMHYAKEKNSGVAIFTKDLRTRFLERVRLENDLRHAVDRNELSMSYQPLISLEDGTLLGFEALLRWQHSEIGNIPPNLFIPIA